MNDLTQYSDAELEGLSHGLTAERHALRSKGLAVQRELSRRAALDRQACAFAELPEDMQASLRANLPHEVADRVAKFAGFRTEPRAIESPSTEASPLAEVDPILKERAPQPWWRR